MPFFGGGGGGGAGTVTDVSVVTANGLSGTVADSTTTPAITLNIAALDAAKIADGTVSSTEFQFINTLSSNAQTQIDAKAPIASPTFTGTVTIPTPFTLGAVSVTPTGTELNFVDGVTSAIQTQLDGKIGGSTGATDNSVLRANGTGGATAQNSGIQIDDSNVIGATGALIALRVDTGQQIYYDADGHNFRLGGGGANLWGISSSGLLATGGDNTYDIGAAGANRPRTGYFATGIAIEATITAAGTTGAQTINKTAGSVNFGIGASSLVVTDDKVTANSIVMATVATNDSTLKSVQAVAGVGSFTLFGNAAATAETRVNFWVLTPD